jgi:hypothetical protein
MIVGVGRVGVFMFCVGDIEDRWGGCRCEWYYVVRNTINRRGLRSCRQGVSVVLKTHELV